MRFPHRGLFKVEPTGASPSNTGTAEGLSDFDTNMLIILAALFCALVIVLGLNILVRCTLRRRSEEQVEARLTSTTGSTNGLKKRALQELPMVVYGLETANIPVTECPICLGEFVEGEKIRVLPKCNHRFHVRCIDTWLVSNPSCPNCRHSLIDQP